MTDDLYVWCLFSGNYDHIEIQEYLVNIYKTREDAELAQKQLPNYQQFKIKKRKVLSVIRERD